MGVVYVPSVYLWMGLIFLPVTFHRRKFIFLLRKEDEEYNTQDPYTSF
jgi:hypothetical protein